MNVDSTMSLKHQKQVELKKKGQLKMNAFLHDVAQRGEFFTFLKIYSSIFMRISQEYSFQ